MNDPIVDEVRRLRNEHSASLNYDLDAMFREIKEHEKLSGRVFVSIAQEAEPPQSKSRASIPITKPSEPVKSG